MNLHLRVFGDLAEQPQSLLHILLGSGNRRVASCFDYSTKQSSHFFMVWLPWQELLLLLLLLSLSLLLEWQVMEER